MEWAELVLEYVRALAWPAVVGGAVFAFRHQVAAKISDLKEATTPVGGASFFDRTAEALEEKAEQVTENSEPVPPPSAPNDPRPDEDSPRGTAEEATPETKDASQRPDDAAAVSEGEAQAGALPPQPAERDKQSAASLWRELTLSPGAEKHGVWQAEALAKALQYLYGGGPDFSEAQRVALESPQAAVLLAYREFERVARSTLAAAQPNAPVGKWPMTQVVNQLTELNMLSKGLRVVAHNLAELRGNVAHASSKSEAVSAKGAMSFIATCQQLTAALTRSAAVRLPATSTTAAINRWVSDMEEMSEQRRRESQLQAIAEAEREKIESARKAKERKVVDHDEYTD